MEMRSKIKIMLLALAICVVFLIVFNDFHITSDTGHECHEDHSRHESADIKCHVCLKIELARFFFKTLKLISFGFFPAALLLYFACKKSEYSDFIFYILSPVKFKVRMNF